MSKQYEAAGVSLDKGYETIKRIQKYTPDIGDFGGMFDLSQIPMKHPVLVSGTDGVGTKLDIAKRANRHDTIGIDLVAMCANDVITKGAIPLFFLDYFSTSNLDPNLVEDIIKGIANGCQQAKAKLIGGETAEMPDMYQNNDYDLAGFMVGIVDKENMIDKKRVNVNDVIIGLPSSGLHSNGFSLVRKILFKDHMIDINKQLPMFDAPLKDVLLTPTKIYVNAIKKVINTIDIHSIAHITGGGFYENIPRAIPNHLGATIKLESIPTPPIFTFLQDLSQTTLKEMYHVFNMGIGMILIVDPQDEVDTLDLLTDEGAITIGKVTKAKGLVLQ